MRRRPPSATAAIAVGERVLGVGVEGADQRQLAGRAAARPSRAIGTTGSWMCSDVVAALAQLVAQREDGVRRERHVRDGAVGGEADGAPERDEALGRRMALRARAAVQAPRERVVGVERREDARLVAGRGELAPRAPRCGA